MKNAKKALILMEIIIFLLSLSTIVNAAGSFNVSVTSTSLTVGQTTKLNIKTTNAEGKFSITSLNPDVVSVEKASVWVSSNEGITLTAKSAGTANIIIKPISVSDTDLNLITNSQTVKITVKDKSQPAPPSTSSNNNNNSKPVTTKSSDTSLKSVTVNGKSYTIGKSITVGADTSSINIKATANSSKAKVTGTGTKELETGTNNFNIKVTAEDGGSKTYKVTVIREEQVDDNPNIEDPNQLQAQELRLSSLKIQGVELNPTFNSEVFEYTVYVVNENELKIDAISNMEETKIEISGNTNLIEGENIATIKLIKDDKTVEYKIKINKTVVQEEDSETEEKKVGFIGWINDWWNGSGSTITVFTIILILLGTAMVFAITSYKYSNTAISNSRHNKVENSIEKGLSEK